MFGKNLSWWYWLATVALLTLGLAGWNAGFYLAIALGALQLGHFAWRAGNWTDFSVQLRAAYLGLLVLALWEPARFVYWIQLVGTSAVVLTGYCFLARSLSLLPWNRHESLSFQLLRKTFFTSSFDRGQEPTFIAACGCVDRTCAPIRSETHGALK